jgi:hypothetical protein
MLRYTAPTARFCTISVPHPFAFFLAKGWDGTKYT